MLVVYTDMMNVEIDDTVYLTEEYAEEYAEEYMEEFMVLDYLADEDVYVLCSNHKCFLHDHNKISHHEFDESMFNVPISAIAHNDSLDARIKGPMDAISTELRDI